MYFYIYMYLPRSLLKWLFSYFESDSRYRSVKFINILFYKIITQLITIVCAVCMLSCIPLYDPVDCSLPGSSAHGILQARILEWVAISSCRGSSWCRDQIRFSCISCIAGRFFTTEPPGSPQYELHLFNISPPNFSLM